MIIGVTGQSGSGKTTAAHIFEKHGFYHLNCDAVVHEKVHKMPRVLELINDAFGSGYVLNGVLQKRKLGELVFSDKEAYTKLNGIFVPAVSEEILSELSKHKDENILLDAPLLFEYSLDKMCDYTVGIVSDNSAMRICERDGISVLQAQARISNQKNAEYFYKNCDFVVVNNGTVQQLEKSITDIISAVSAGA